MSKPISLSKARKQRARAEKRQKGDENAAIHGRSKAEKLRDKAATEKLNRHLDQHRKDR